MLGKRRENIYSSLPCRGNHISIHQENSACTTLTANDFSASVEKKPAFGPGGFKAPYLDWRDGQVKDSDYQGLADEAKIVEMTDEIGWMKTSVQPVENLRAYKIFGWLRVDLYILVSRFTQVRSDSWALKD